MKTRSELMQARQPSWRRLEALLGRAESLRGASRLRPGEIAELGELYRALASDLMTARRDRLGADLERYLDGLAARAHNALHAGARRAGKEGRMLDLLWDFPGAVRRNAKAFALAFALFFGPALVTGLGTYGSESFAARLLGADQMRTFETMYAEAPYGRASSVNAGMTGFYVWNNVGIAFRCFATGILFGLGSIWFLVSNGLFLGGVLGHLTRAGLGENIFTFISAHGPWELIAIVISGAAGLQMGLALVVTGGRTRLGSLQARGPELIRQVAGAAAFLVVAALLEAWVSPAALPMEAKLGLGAGGWVLVAGILALGGRRRPRPPDVAASSAGGPGE